MRGLVLVVALVACGEDTSGGPYVPIDMFESAVHDARCEHLVRCGEFPDAATCARYALVSSVDLAASPQLVAAVLAGKVFYNGANVAACVAAIAGATCDVTDQDGRSLPKVCTQIFRGAVTGGGTCAFDAECISTACNTTCGDASTCCTGTCIGSTPPQPPPLAPIGASCVQKGCVDGSFCDTNFQVCTALLGANKPCSSPSQCAYGLSCFGASSLTCRPLPALGEPCPDGMCRDEGQHCKLPAGGGTAVCVTAGLVGADCGFSTDCSPYLHCDTTTSRCAVEPAVGESCANTGACADSVVNYCDTTTLICKARQPVGTPCTNSEQCTSHFCDGQGTCSQLEACT